MSLKQLLYRSKPLGAKISLAPIKIETDRLLIRPYNTLDFEKSVALYGNPVITKFFDYGIPRSRTEVKKLTEKASKPFSKGHLFGLFSILKKDTMQFIGHLDCLPTKTTGIFEIGYILDQHFQKQGYCTEAMQAFLFEYIPLIKKKMKSNPPQGIIATVHPENQPSQKILKKMGMKFNSFEIRFRNPRMKYFLAIS